MGVKMHCIVIMRQWDIWNESLALSLIFLEGHDIHIW